MSGSRAFGTGVPRVTYSVIDRAGAARVERQEEVEDMMLAALLALIGLALWATGHLIIR